MLAIVARAQSSGHPHLPPIERFPSAGPPGAWSPGKFQTRCGTAARAAGWPSAPGDVCGQPGDHRVRGHQPEQLRPRLHDCQVGEAVPASVTATARSVVTFPGACTAWPGRLRSRSAAVVLRLIFDVPIGGPAMYLDKQPTLTTCAAGAGVGPLVQTRYMAGRRQVHRWTEKSAVRQLQPGHRPLAAPSPTLRDPQRAEARGPPPASRPAGPAPAPKGCPRSVTSTQTMPSPRPHRDRGCRPEDTRPAVPDAVAKQLAHQQDGRIPARVSGTEHPAHERPRDPHPFLPPDGRHAPRTAVPAITAPALPGPPPGNRPRGGRTQEMHSQRPATLAVARPYPQPLSVAVRAKPTVPPTVPGHVRTSAMRPWIPRHAVPQRYKVTHGGTDKKRPA